MKKVLAIVLSLIMAFSMAVIPVGAAIEAGEVHDTVNGAVGVYGDAAADAKDVVGSGKDVYDNIQKGDYAEALKAGFVFAEKLANAIHSLVGSIMYLVDNDCPFCGKMHMPKEDAGDDSDVTEEPTTEEPTTEEPTTEEPTTEEPTTEEPTTEEPTTEEPTTEEPTTEEPTTEEPTTEEPTTEEPTTQPAVTYETYSVRVSNSTLAVDRDYNYTSDGLYAIEKDVALYFWNRGYKANTVTIKNMATAYVNAAVYIDVESVGINTIVFAGGNSFHKNGGVFKLIVNTTDIPVKVKLSGTNKFTDGTAITSSNIGDYIVGPYTLV